MQINKINRLIENSDNKIYLILTNRSLYDKKNHRELYNIFKQITNQLKHCDKQIVVEEFRNNILSLNKYDDEMVRIRFYRVILYILYLDLNEDDIDHGFVQKMFNVIRSDNEQYGGANYNQNILNELNDKFIARISKLKIIVDKTEKLLSSIYEISNLSGASTHLLLNFKIAISYLLQQLKNTGENIDFAEINQNIGKLEELIKKSLEIQGNIQSLENQFKADDVFRTNVLEYVPIAMKLKTDDAVKKATGQAGGANIIDDEQIMLTKILLNDNTITEYSIKEFILNSNLTIYLQTITVIFDIVLNINNMINTQEKMITKIINRPKPGGGILFVKFKRLIEMFKNFSEFIKNIHYNSKMDVYHNSTKFNFMPQIMQEYLNLKPNDDSTQIEDKTTCLSRYNLIFQTYYYDILNIIHYYDYIEFDDLDVDIFTDKYQKIYEIIENISDLIYIFEVTVEEFHKKFTERRSQIFDTLDSDIIIELEKAILDSRSSYMKEKFEQIKDKYIINSLMNKFLPVYPQRTSTFTGGARGDQLKSINPINKSDYSDEIRVIKNFMYRKPIDFKNALYNKALDMVEKFTDMMKKKLKSDSPITTDMIDTTLEEIQFMKAIQKKENVKIKELLAVINRYLDGIGKNLMAFKQYVLLTKPTSDIITALKLNISNPHNISKNIIPFLLECLSFVPPCELKIILDHILKKTPFNAEIQCIYDIVFKQYIRQNIYKSICEVCLDAYDETNFKQSLEKILKQLIDKTGEIPTSEIKIEGIYDIMYTMEKLITLSLNAIKVFVKFRYESDDNGNDLSNYTFNSDKGCITITTQTGKTTYGQFNSVFATKTDDQTMQKDKTKYLNTSHLYCGNEGCERPTKIITGGVKDLIKQEFQCTTFETVGVSGAGKTALLFGKNDEIKNDGLRIGLVSRIIEDILKDTPIIGIDTVMRVDILFGEVYGEKLSYNISDDKFMECLILWRLGHYKDKIDDNFLTKIEEDYYVLSDLDISQIDTRSHYSIIKGIQTCYNTRGITVTNNLTGDDNFYTKCVNLDFSNSGSSKDFFEELYGIQYFGSVEPSTESKSKKTTYEIFTNEEKNEYYLQYKKTVVNKDDINKGASECSQLVDKIFSTVNSIRTKNDRVRCTINNIESSRSQLFVIFVVYICGKKRYFVIFDKAGNESPYEIAAAELEKILLPSEKKHKGELLKSLITTNVTSIDKRIDIFQLISYLFLYYNFYKKIIFKNNKKDDKTYNCNEDTFISSYKSFVDLTSYLLRNYNYINQTIFTEPIKIHQHSLTSSNIVIFSNRHSSKITKLHESNELKKILIFIYLKKFIFYGNILIIILFMTINGKFSEVIKEYSDFIASFFNIDDEMKEFITYLLDYTSDMRSAISDHKPSKYYKNIYDKLMTEFSSTLSNVKDKRFDSISIGSASSKDFISFKFKYLLMICLSNINQIIEYFIKYGIINIKTIQVIDNQGTIITHKMRDSDDFLSENYFKYFFSGYELPTKLYGKITGNGEVHILNGQYALFGWNDGNRNIIVNIMAIINTVLKHFDAYMIIDKAASSDTAASSATTILSTTIEDETSKYLCSYHLFKTKKQSSVIKVSIRRRAFADEMEREYGDYIYIPFIVLMNYTDIKRHFVFDTSTPSSEVQFIDTKLKVTQINWSITKSSSSSNNEFKRDIIKSAVFEFNDKQTAETLEVTDPLSVSPSPYAIASKIRPILEDYVNVTGIKMIEKDTSDRAFLNARELLNNVRSFIINRYLPDDVSTADLPFEVLLSKVEAEMLRDYLLSGLQGFMINDSNRHSIESNAIMTRKELYTDFVRVFNNPNYDLGDIDEKVRPLYQLTKLMPYNLTSDDKKNFVDEIMSHALNPTNYTSRRYDGSCQIYKTTPYNVKYRIWLKLIWTIRHLGASCDIFKISDDISEPQNFNFTDADITNYSSTDVKKKLQKIKDYTIRKPYTKKAVTSYSNVLLLAATTLPRKVESVRLTLQAAQVIARLTGPECDSGKIDQEGGSYQDFNHLFKKSYRNYINGLNKSYKQKILK